jgi:hypothetical protein
MNTIQKFCSGLLLIIVMASCQKQTNDNIDFLKTGKPITDFAFTANVSNAGTATVVPVANGISGFTINWGDASAPEKVDPTKTATHDYNDGTYTIRVVARNLSGDSLVLTRSITATTNQILVDFESSATINGNSFGGAAFSRVANPSVSGINTSANVCRIIKGLPTAPSETWAGMTINTPTTPLAFSKRGIIRMKVFAPRVGAVYLFKLENPSSGSTVETQAVTTVANAWQELTFVMDPSVVGRSFTGFSVFFEFGLAGNGSSNFTGFFDDVKIFP